MMFICAWMCLFVSMLIACGTWVVNMAAVDAVREKALLDYRKKLLEHKEVESRLKESMYNIDLLRFYKEHYLIMHTNLDSV
jgi:hypothetical protein